MLAIKRNVGISGEVEAMVRGSKARAVSGKGCRLARRVFRGWIDIDGQVDDEEV